MLYSLNTLYSLELSYFLDKIQKLAYTENTNHKSKRLVIADLSIDPKKTLREEKLIAISIVLVPKKHS